MKPCLDRVASQAMNENDADCCQIRLQADSEEMVILEVDIGAIVWLIDHAESSGLDLFSWYLHRARRENVEKPTAQRFGVCGSV